MIDQTRKLLHQNVLCTGLQNFQLDLLTQIDSKEIWCLLETSPGAGATYILAAYALEQAFLNPGINIGIFSADWRQSKNLMGYIEIFWPAGQFKKETDCIRIKIGDSQIISFPIGQSRDRICGQRANILIFPNFSDIPEELFETLIAGHHFSCNPPIGIAPKFKQSIIMSEHIGYGSYYYNKYREMALTNNKLIKGDVNDKSM
jgi:hypothetical protein